MQRTGKFKVNARANLPEMKRVDLFLTAMINLIVPSFNTV